MKPGAYLEILVPGKEALSGVYLVRSGGYIIIKDIGRVQVADKKLQDAANELAKTLGTTNVSALIQNNPRLEGEKSDRSPQGPSPKPPLTP